MSDLGLTGTFIFRNAVSLGYPILESFLSAIGMTDEQIVCADPDSDNETIRLVHVLEEKFPTVRTVWFRWPIGETGDGSVIGIASSYALAQVRTSHVINVQSDEIYPTELSTHIKENWRSWASIGIECMRLKILNLEHNMQGFQGGGNFDWQNGAGYNHSYKMVKKCLNTRYLHDAWSFDHHGFVCGDVTFSEKFPVVHAHDNFRDSLTHLRRVAATEIWTDERLGPMYKKSADDLESSQDQWYNDPLWINTDSPFAYLLPDFAKPILGQTSYRVNYDLLRNF